MYGPIECVVEPRPDVDIAISHRTLDYLVMLALSSPDDKQGARNQVSFTLYLRIIYDQNPA